MLPSGVPIPQKWTDKDRWICTFRWLQIMAHSIYESADPNYQGITFGEKGDPCFECPAGDRCPAFCDKTHWKRYNEFYAFENFKVVEQFIGESMTTVDMILKEIDDANKPKDISSA